MFPERGEVQIHRNRWDKNCCKTIENSTKWHQEQRRPPAPVWRGSVDENIRHQQRKSEKKETTCALSSPSDELSGPW